MAQSALPVAAQRVSEGVEAVGDGTGVHQVAGQNEERHGQDWEAVDSGYHLLDGDQRWNALDDKIDRCRPTNGDEDRRADQHQGRERKEQQRHGVRLPTKARQATQSRRMSPRAIPVATSQ
jgi:hypothetical protein